mmetsp:Transcript_87007/g.202555  ORF Transcript_87007/g.202555 Transcript_87007/m.202555 type:complete len:435 (+) Transcript_87007:1-1305(+)
MPCVYLHADMLLHVDGCYDSASMRGGHVTLEPEDLEGVRFCRVASSWQVEWLTEELQHDIRPGDLVVAEDTVDLDIPVASCPFRRLACRLTIERQDYGASNRTPAAQRGWVYLERFITMARVAMVGLEHFDRCVICTTAEVRRIIEDGARKLVHAVEEGRLAEELPAFKAELLGKHFSATSTDGRMLDSAELSFTRDSTLGTPRSDAAIVCGIMDDIVAHLRDSWQEVREAVDDDVDAAILGIEAQLYGLVKVDPLLCGFFDGTKCDSIHKNQGRFFRELWLGRRPNMRPALHRLWNIQKEHFEAFMGHFDAALREHFGDLTRPRVAAFRKAVLEYEPLIVQGKTRVVDPPRIEDATGLAKWLREACEEARLGALPEHCALQAAIRLQQAHAGKALGGLACPSMMSSPAAASLVKLLPPSLQAAGRTAWTGVGR